MIPFPSFRVPSSWSWGSMRCLIRLPGASSATQASRPRSPLSVRPGAAAGPRAAGAGMQRPATAGRASTQPTQPPFTLSISCASHFTDKETEAQRGAVCPAPKLVMNRAEPTSLVCSEPVLSVGQRGCTGAAPLCSTCCHSSLRLLKGTL